MTEEESAPKKGRGRPKKLKEDKVELKFHLVLLDEEMELFKAAAQALGFMSTAIFIRTAIDEAGTSAADVRKWVPKKLAPSPDDTTLKHYIFYISPKSRAIIDRENLRAHSEFIRVAALSKVFRDKIKHPAVDAAVEVLKKKKGA